MLKKNRFLIAAAAFVVTLSVGGALYADVDMSKIHAYPVPYNPKKNGAPKTITFTGFSNAACSVKMEVFDINGDPVVTRTFSSAANVRWNARNISGKLVSPGMYIVKLSVEDDGTGDFGKKIIRVLIAY